MLQALDGNLSVLQTHEALPLQIEDVLLLQLLHLHELLLEGQLFAAQLLLLRTETDDTSEVRLSQDRTMKGGTEVTG